MDVGVRGNHKTPSQGRKLCSFFSFPVCGLCLCMWCVCMCLRVLYVMCVCMCVCVVMCVFVCCAVMCVCVCVYDVCMDRCGNSHVTVCVWRSEDSFGDVFLHFYTVQVSRLCLSEGHIVHPAFMWIWGSVFSKLFISWVISPVLLKFLKEKKSSWRSRACMAWFSSQKSFSRQLAAKMESWKWKVENYTNLFFTLSLVLGLVHLSPQFFTEPHTYTASHAY